MFSLGDRELTRIGLGTNRLRDLPEHHAFLREAVAAGIEFIDTAHLYSGGESEQAIGAALAGASDDVVIATKGGYHPGAGLDGLRAQLEQSFERLCVDVIDLYYLHRVDPDIPIEKSVGLIAEYVEVERVRHVGISDVSVEQIQRARSVVPIAAVQNEFNLGERADDAVIGYCEAEGILFVPFYPLHGGDDTAIQRVAGRHGASSNQIKLAWLLHRSPVVAPIPGTLSPEHMRENLAALDIELSDSDLAEIGP